MWRSRNPAIALTVSMAIAVPTSLFAWGNEGHQLVGNIAEAALAHDPVVLQRIQTIFGPGSHLRDIGPCADRIRDFVRSQGKASLDATCSPFVAKFSTPQGLLARFPHSDKWHFIDIPVDGHTHSLADVNSFRGVDLCAPERIEHYKGVLTSNASLSVQAEAVLFLTHLVGDLHQPLHSAARNNDAGGNSVIVTVFGQVSKLHHVWDDEIIVRMRDDHGTPITSDTARSKHLIASLPSPGNFAPWQWALDAYQLATNTAYVDLGETPAGKSIPDVRNAPGTTLHDNNYLAAADPVTQRQLRLAGVRLAAVLRDRLGN